MKGFTRTAQPVPAQRLELFDAKIPLGIRPDTADGLEDLTLQVDNIAEIMDASVRPEIVEEALDRKLKIFRNLLYPGIDMAPAVLQFELENRDLDEEWIAFLKEYNAQSQQAEPYTAAVAEISARSLLDEPHRRQFDRRRGLGPRAQMLFGKSFGHVNAAYNRNPSRFIDRYAPVRPESPVAEFGRRAVGDVVHASRGVGNLITAGLRIIS